MLPRAHLPARALYTARARGPGMNRDAREGNAGRRRGPKEEVVPTSLAACFRAPVDLLLLGAPPAGVGGGIAFIDRNLVVVVFVW